MRNVRNRPVIATLLLATALTTFGCRRPIEGTIMADKPPRSSVVLRDVQEEVKSPKRALDAVPQKTEEVKAEEAKEKKPKLAPRRANIGEPPKPKTSRFQ